MLFINKICLNQLTHIEKKITAANALISTGQGSVVEKTNVLLARSLNCNVHFFSTLYIILITS
jgi:hypothetical protein